MNAISELQLTTEGVTSLLTRHNSGGHLGSSNWGDNIGVNVILGTLSSKRLCEASHGHLGSGVVGLSEVAVKTGC